MNYQHYEKIIERLGEILVACDTTSVRIDAGGVEMTVQRTKQPVAPAVAKVAPSPPKSTAGPKDKPSPKKPARSITAPRVGIFHLRDPKTSEPMVIVGDELKKGGSVGFIEALGKRFTVKSEQAGKVSRILIEDEMAVEYGQPLIELGD